MAKIYTNNPPFVGTREDITIYRMKADGVYYMRMKSSLTGKRVKKDPAFRGLMRHAGIMAIAAPLASAVYRLLPEAEREVALYRKMTGMAQRMLKEGYSEEAVKGVLIEQFASSTPPKKVVAVIRTAVNVLKIPTYHYKRKRVTLRRRIRPVITETG